MTKSKKESYLEQRKLLVEDRKKEVIDVAKRLFLQRGLNNVTMNDIMSESGLSKATMYRYFESIHPIAFEVEYIMINEIYSDVKSKDLSRVNGSELMKEILLTMVDKFTDHISAYSYSSMFDYLYAEKYPDDNLSLQYNEFLQLIIKENTIADIPKEQYNAALTYVSIIFAYLQKLAHRKEIINEGEIDINQRLDIVRSMISQLFQ